MTNAGDGLRVSPAGLIGRVAGNLLWQALPQGQRPVETVAGESARRGARERSRRAVLTLIPWLLAVPAAAWLVAVTVHFQRAAMDNLRNPPGASIHETAQRLRASGSGVWAGLHPTAAARLRRLAGEVEAGGDALRAVEAERSRAAQSLADLGPAGRLQRGQVLTATAREKLAAIRTPWHRETFAFRELSRALEPYGHPPEEIRLEGRVTALPPGRAIQLTPLAADGAARQAATEPLHPGDPFDFAAPLGGQLLLTDLQAVESSGLYRVVGEARLDLASWSEKPVPLPGGGGEAQVKFGATTSRIAPSLASPSPAGAAELAPGGSSTRN